MLQLATCSRCRGFLGIAMNACPHCGAALGRARRIAMGIVGVAGGSAVSMTLMACYGPPCVNDAKCTDMMPDDAGHTLADAHVGELDAGHDGGGGDAEADGGRDAAADAPSDAPHDAPHDAPDAD